MSSIIFNKPTKLIFITISSPINYIDILASPHVQLWDYTLSMPTHKQPMHAMTASQWKVHCSAVSCWTQTIFTHLPYMQAYCTGETIALHTELLLNG